MSRKYLLIALVITVALALSLASGALAAPTYPAHRAWIILQKPDGNPFAGETVTVVIFNETGNCLLVAGKGVTDTNGNLTLTIYDRTHGGTLVAPAAGTYYNISVFWEKYGKTFLLFNLSGDGATVLAYLNDTLTIQHYWEVWFRAMTDLDQNGAFETPLVFKDVELGIWDLPYFKVYADEIKPENLIWEAEGNQSLPLAGGAAGYAVKPFQAGTIVVTLSQTDPRTALCLHIDEMYNFTIYKEVYWRINENPDILMVKVGEERLIFNYTFSTDTEQIFYTDLVEKKLWEKVNGAGTYPYEDLSILLSTLDSGITLADDHIVAFWDRAYTFLAEVIVVSPCGVNLTEWGNWIWPPVGVEFEVESLGKLRTGKMEPTTSRAPFIGYPGYYGYFWLPNITAIYDVNVTLKIEIMGVQVFHETFNTTQRIPGNHAGIIWSDDAGQYLYWNVTSVGSYLVSHFWANVSVVETDIIIKDSGPNPVQPLEGVKVIIEPPGYDPINTVTDYGGHIQLPPFGLVLGGTDSLGGPIIARMGVWPGLLPVPFDFRTTGDLYTYKVRVFVPLPGTEDFVEVTPEDNEVALNLTLYLLGDRANDIAPCTTQTFHIFAEVYRVNFKVVDLCDRPLTTRDDPRATVILTWTPPGATEPAITFSAGLGPDGVVYLSTVPGGEITVKLAFKGVLMDPVGEPTKLVIDTNVWNLSEAKFTFPVGDLTLRVTQWDLDEPLGNITVTLNYYKNDEVMFTETQLTDICDGTVTFEKVPLRVSESSTATNKILVELYTNENTPYIRSQDAGILVGKWDLTNTILGEIEPACEVGPIDIPAWIFSFTLEATDHKGEVLKELDTDIGTAWVAVALNDTTYGRELNLTMVCAGENPCPCTPEILVDYRIFNWTGHELPIGNEKSEAVFLYTSSQFHEVGGPYPHLFVAGANYTFIVWYGGVVVYNYTITLPRPSAELDWTEVVDSQVVLFNETDWTTTIVDGDSLDYTWNIEKGGEITHPILRFYGAPWWKEGGERYSIKLQLITWVIDLDVYALSNAGEGLIPGLNLTLIRADAVNWTWIEEADTYTRLTHVSQFHDQVGMVAWNAVDDNFDGIITIPVAVWLPARGVNEWHAYGARFGVILRYVLLLAGSEWGTPNVPDTPYAFDVYMYSYLLGHYRDTEIYGYLVGPWNATAGEVQIQLASYSGGRYWATELYPEWYKKYEGTWVGPFRANVSTPFIGGIPHVDQSSWNLTLWSGAAKIVKTTGMDGFCACVYGPDFRDNMIGLAKQPVKVEAVGDTGATVELTTGTTGDDGCATFLPETDDSVETPIGAFPVYKDVVAFKFDVDFEFGWIPGIELSYKFTTWLNLDEKLKLGEYGLTTSDIIDPDYLTVTVIFGEDHNKGSTCVELEWDAIKVTVYDWAGRPLKNAMVAAILRTPRSKSIPSVVDFTYDNGSVILYVPPGSQTYQLLVYWRDSYLLYRAGAIPKEIVIFDTVTDYDTPRTYTPGSGTTLETFVYIGIIKLLNANGEPLSPEALSKITVTIKWPDQVVTEHKPKDDGRVMIILNKDTVKSWPLDVSATCSPDTPFDIESQAPHGAYLVTVTWAGIGEVAKTTINIEKGRFETSRQVFEVRLDVVDVELSFKSPFDTPLAGATVEIKKPDGETVTGVLDNDGKIAITEVPPGKLTVTVKDWKGLSVGYTATIDRNVAGVTVPKIGKLTVKVVGSRGQGLEGASVSIDKVGTFSTDASGTVTVEVPSGSYAVSVSKGGRTASTTATVNDGKITEVELKLDIFVTIAGWELSSSEFLGLLLLLVILVIVLFIIAHEYSAWRKRRLAKVIAPAKEA